MKLQDQDCHRIFIPILQYFPLPVLKPFKKAVYELLDIFGKAWEEHKESFNPGWLAQVQKNIGLFSIKCSNTYVHASQDFPVLNITYRACLFNGFSQTT